MVSTATKRKPGPAPKSAADLRASGSWRGKAKKEVGERKNKAWSRERPGPESILDPNHAITLIPGFDPHANSDGCIFDADEARSAVQWVHEHCTHAKGTLGGNAYELDALEQAIVCNLFGWKREDGTRRFRKSLVYVARKWGKTLFAAAIALYMLMELRDDDYAEEGVEAYCAASARDQAKLLWNVAKRIVQNDEYLSERIRVYQHSMARIGFDGELDGSYFQSISKEANTAHGFNPQTYVLDELHAQPDGELLDVLDTGTASRSQPLAVLITTADFVRESICNEEYAYAKGVRDGTIFDPFYLPVIFEAEPGDDWTDEAVWKKANPKYPLTPTQGYMESQCKKAQSSPRFLNTFKRLNLNMRTESDVQWFDLSRWDRLGGGVSQDSLLGCRCYGGLDMSSVSDLTAFVLWFPDDGNVILPFFWVPRDTVNRRIERNVLPSYAAWEESGDLEVCSGGWIDQDVVLNRVRECAQLFDLRQVAVDRWNSAKASTELMKDGINIVLFGQGFASMSGPSKELERLYLAGDIRHGNHPVMRWCAGNVMAETDHSPAENIKPVKPKGKNKARKQDDNKIDGIVAAIMALGIAMNDISEGFSPNVA